MTHLAPFLLLVVWLFGAVGAGITVRPAPPEPPENRTARRSPTTPVDLTWAGNQVILTAKIARGRRWHFIAPVPTFLAAWLHEDSEARSHPGGPSREDAYTGSSPLFSLPTPP